MKSEFLFFIYYLMYIIFQRAILMSEVWENHIDLIILIKISWVVKNKVPSYSLMFSVGLPLSSKIICLFQVQCRANFLLSFYQFFSLSSFKSFFVVCNFSCRSSCCHRLAWLSFIDIFGLLWDVSTCFSWRTWIITKAKSIRCGGQRS